MKIPLFKLNYNKQRKGTSHVKKQSTGMEVLSFRKEMKRFNKQMQGYKRRVRAFNKQLQGEKGVKGLNKKMDVKQKRQKGIKNIMQRDDL